MRLRVPVRTLLVTALAAMCGYALHPTVTVGVLAGVAVLGCAAAVFALDVAARRGRSAARRWQR